MATKGSKTINIRSEVNKSLTTHTNLNQHILVISEDKVRLAMIKYDKQYEKNHDWISPLSIAITILIAIFTADFKTTLFIDAKVLEAAAYLLCIVFAYKTIKNGYYTYRGRKNRITHDQMIESLRENSENIVDKDS